MTTSRYTCGETKLLPLKPLSSVISAASNSNPLPRRYSRPLMGV